MRGVTVQAINGASREDRRSQDVAGVTTPNMHQPSSGKKGKERSEMTEIGQRNLLNLLALLGAGRGS